MRALGTHRCQYSVAKAWEREMDDLTYRLVEAERDELRARCNLHEQTIANLSEVRNAMAEVGAAIKAERDELSAELADAVALVKTLEWAGEGYYFKDEGKVMGTCPDCEQPYPIELFLTEHDDDTARAAHLPMCALATFLAKHDPTRRAPAAPGEEEE
jgi:DNA repair exonuclease SbcCD ATPase subunit